MNSMESYRISEEMGFFLENHLTQLPGEYSTWINLLRRIPTFLEQGLLREMVHKLPLLDGSALQTHQEMRLGRLAVACLTCGYVWQNGETDVPTKLPNVLAVPLYNLSTRLGIAPIASHVDLVLANTKFKKPLDEIQDPMQDMSLEFRIVNDKGGDAFFLVTALCDLRFRRAIKPLMEAVRLSNEIGHDMEHSNLLAHHLMTLKSIVDDVKTATSLFHKILDPKVFYNRIRPLLNGWDQNSSVFPNGLIFEGVSDKPMFCHGSSAAQSPIFQCVDSLLGIKHRPAQGKFLDLMRKHMLREHREFLSDIEKHSRVKEAVAKSGCPELTKAFNSLVTATEEFRSYHISIVTKFIIIPAKTENNKFKSLKSTGTGGQDLVKFLKSVRDTTKTSALPTNNNEDTETNGHHEELIDNRY